jgi:hypothetical protein
MQVASRYGVRISMSEGYARYAFYRTPRTKIHNFGSQTISTTGLILCRMRVEVNTEVSRSLLTLVHIMYLLLFLFLLARRSQQVLCLRLERGLKPLPNEFRVNIIKINSTTNYQLLLNCNKVHRAQ